jgi:hypothetical protein
MVMLLLVAGLTAYWGYDLIRSLLDEFASQINWVDLLAIFVMGMLSGVTLGLALAIWRKKALPD